MMEQIVDGYEQSFAVSAAGAADEEEPPEVVRKAVKAALRSALAAHVEEGSLSLVDAASFGAPSTKQAAAMNEKLPLPIVLVYGEDEIDLAKSFRNLDRVAVVLPWELEVGAVVWARSLVISSSALLAVEARARG